MLIDETNLPYGRFRACNIRQLFLGCWQGDQEIQTPRVSSPQVNEPVYETPPTPVYHPLVGVTIILILLVSGAAKNTVESVVIINIKGSVIF